jgi:hypothetical protein
MVDSYHPMCYYSIVGAIIKQQELLTFGGKNAYIQHIDTQKRKIRTAQGK